MLLMMTVDTEEEWDWEGPFPVEGCRVDNVTRLGRFQTVCSTYGIATTYFVNYTVIADPRARDVLLELQSAGGAELGMHIHPWNTPPLEPGRVVTSRESFLHTYPDPMIRRKLDASFDAFRRTGVTPTSFRGGRYSSSVSIQRWLIDHGFVADCSVVPYTRGRDVGSPDYLDRDLFPVRLQPPGALQPLWEIPLTVGFTRRPFELWARAFDRIERSRLASLRLIGLAHRLSLVRRLWLNFDMPHSDGWLDLIRELMDSGVPSVTITVHSTSLVAGMNPYTRTTDDERRLYARIERFFGELARVPGLSFCTASDAARALERSRQHDGSGTDDGRRSAARTSGRM